MNAISVACLMLCSTHWPIGSPLDWTIVAIGTSIRALLFRRARRDVASPRSVDRDASSAPAARAGTGRARVRRGT